MKKYVQKMWRIHDVLFLDKAKAEEVEDGKEVVKEVFVSVDDDGIKLDPNGVSTEYFGSWIFNNVEEAQREVDEFNNA